MTVARVTRACVMVLHDDARDDACCYIIDTRARRCRRRCRRRRRLRAHGGVGVRDGGSEWRREKRRAHVRGGRGTHEKRVTSHHVVRRTDGGADGRTYRRTEDGQTEGWHHRRCRAPPPPPRSRLTKSTLVVPAEEGSGFKEFGSRVWTAGGSSLRRSLRGQRRNAEVRRHGRRRRSTRASRGRRGACRARRTHLEAWSSLASPAVQVVARLTLDVL